MSKIKMLRKEAQVALPTSGETYVAEDGTVSMVMDDNFDPGYEASQQEVLEYAEWLGMKFPEDEELMWLAKEGLKAPLPKEWKPCKTDTGEVYYFNFKTGDSIWDHPMDDYFKNKFAQEKEKLKKKKAAEARGEIVEQDPLARVGSARNNTIFDEKGVRDAKDDAVSSDDGLPTTPRGTTAKASLSSLSKSASGTAEKKSSLSSLKKVGAEEKLASPRSEQTKPMPAVKEEPKVTTTVKEKKEKKEKKVKEEPAPVSSLAASTSLSSPSLATASPTTTSSTFGLGLGTRLVSEAEKQLQERIRVELETQHNQEVADIEAQHARRMKREADIHNDEIDDINRALNSKKRKAVADIDDAIQDELDTAQRQADQRTQAEVSRLEEEQESWRQRLNEIQSNAQRRLETEGASIGADMDEAVTAKVRGVDDEINGIRQRHRTAQEDRVAKERQRLDSDLVLASSTARDSANRDLAERTNRLREQHASTLQRMRDEAGREMQEESERADRASSGQTAQLVQEVNARRDQDVAAEEANGRSGAATLRAEEQAKMDQLKAQHAQELLGVRQAAMGSTAALNPEKQRQIEQDADAEMASTTAQEASTTTTRIAELEADRQRRLAAAGNASSNSSNADPAALRQELQRAHEAAVAELECKTDSDEATSATDASSWKAAQIAQYTKELEDSRRDALNEHIAGVKSKREKEHAASLAAVKEQERKAQAAADAAKATNAANAAQTAALEAAAAAAASAATSAPAPVSSSPSSPNGNKAKMDDELQAVRLEHELEHSKAVRALRTEYEASRSASIMGLADELAEYERKERRKRDAAMATSPVKTAAPAAHTNEEEELDTVIADEKSKMRLDFSQEELSIRRKISMEKETFQNQLEAMRAAHEQARQAAQSAIASIPPMAPMNAAPTAVMDEAPVSRGASTLGPPISAANSPHRSTHSRQSHTDPQLAEVLLRLDAKLDQLTHKVHKIEEKQARVSSAQNTPSKRRTSSATRRTKESERLRTSRNANTGDKALLDKWGNILDDLDASGGRHGEMANAMKRYIRRDDDLSD